MRTSYALVNTFTTEAFGGNPAAVLLLDSDRDDAWCQAMAAQLAQPATAFISPGYGLRWFSPYTQLVLCGHGSFAAAFTVYETGAVPLDQPVTFGTLSGPVQARREGDRVWVTLPATKLHAEDPPRSVLGALGLSSADGFGQGAEDWVVLLDSPEQVALVLPDFDLLGALPPTRVVVTAPGDQVDFVSRVFAPRIGIVEDQVTGSAHAALGPYWAARLGRSKLSAVQASARRGQLDLEVEADVVHLGGRGLTVVSGELTPAAL